MATFTRSQSLLVSVSLAALGGTALAALLAGGGFILADARATAVDASLPIVNADVPTCGPPTATTRPNMMLRLVQTEVPRAGMNAASPAPAFADTEPPLWTGIGSTTWKVTTANERAQAYFDQGLRLAYAFNHDEARRAFRMAQKLDPDCAMCFWGEALVLGPNINLPMPEDAVAPAYDAAQKAKALAGKASPREQALIGAIAVRYGSDPKAARAPLDAAYAAEMAKAAKQFPEDDEIATLYAEAVMDLSPWDYWKPGGRDAKPQSVPIVPTLERVLARNPNHAGAIHLYIHAVEASDRPKRAEPYADKLRGAVPGAGHLVHMPSHIYYRVGRYLDALEDNKTAVKVDEKYLTETNAPMGVYRLGYYPHNVHFVMASAQMAGDGPTVIAAAEKLGQLIPSEAAKGIAMVQPVKAAPYFAHAQFSTPETILALQDPGDAIPYVKAMWLYVRGVALVANRDFAGATAAASAIETIERTADFKLLTDSGVPAQEVLRIARTVVLARVAQAKGDYRTAIIRFERAAALQDNLAYTEPPYWYYPIRQSLAAVLLQAGRYAEAERQFRRALSRAPANGWSYYGLAELHKARGDGSAARKAEADLVRTWIGDRKLLQVSNL
ncbi:tetratricopeptide repeat protein [Bradyrhizobium sp. AUGA SZCCT0240]|uniref:tetratricopeptide repeat protein n=1 Tax=unclassified Bradyrhizobium TaxID=2631580 RepID=UPI001BA7445D|nr:MULTISPECIES: tetratricopeptide repeat protein [unclassified Bradyrhizobium]MBR1241449.1 tetratricopeptide repeat protein [Bradyrhizobium sp. AUGA SZCCT0274]MBR1258323.1 tetratricopeptide repeat protein [Bradyrhizobium sp. AUGA SZCCT0240]